MDSDYKAKRRLSAKGIASVVKNASHIGQTRWQDETGKIHWTRPHDSIPAVIVPPTPSPVIPPQDTGTLWGRVLTDVEVFGMSRIRKMELENLDIYGNPIPLTNKNGQLIMGLPETVKALDSEFIPMSMGMQFYWFDLLKLYAQVLGHGDDDLINRFRVITRPNAFKTNNQDGANFVTKTNLGSPPLQTEIIVTGNAWLKILDGGTKYQVRGKPAYKFATLDYHTFVAPYVAYTKYNVAEYYFATTVKRNGSTIPLLGDYDIPTPNFGAKDFHFIEASRVQLQPLGSTPTSPYVIV